MVAPNIVHMTVHHSSLPSFAVCMAACNGQQWIAEQLQSILDQQGVAVTVFVSVDQSQDGTEQYMETRAKQDSRIHLLPFGEYFGGAARNFYRLLKEIDFSHFDYIGLSDQDDIWLPDKLLRAHQQIYENAAFAYSSNVIAFWNDGRELLVQKAQAQTEWDFLFEAAGPGCTYVLRRDLAMDIQKAVRLQWDEVQLVGLHDWYIYAFARAKKYRWYIDGRPSMRYRQHDSNQVGVNSGPYAMFHRAKKVIGGWGIEQSQLIAKLLGLERDAFVRIWIGGQRVGLLRLALQAKQCRRATGDKLLFALSCVILALTKGATW